MPDEFNRVVLVEDDADFAEVYRLRLEQDGYQVTVAWDGNDGLELIRRTVPDLVYLDLRMPNLDGISLLRALRDDPATRGVAVVVLSNYDEPELRGQGLELGALDWLVKANVTPAELARRTWDWIRAEEQLAAERAD
jgi:DNA-binding response OmpR family regulator